MRFARVGSIGSEVPVVLPSNGSDEAFDLRPLTPDINGAFLADNGLLRSVQALEAGTLAPIKLSGQRLGSPIAQPQSIYAIGLNYRDHAAETGMDLPTEPLVFHKSPNSISGPNDDILFPPGTEKGDWEVELGVVIGRRAVHLRDVQAAESVIAGYLTLNDVSERTLQFDRGGQWTKGKSYPTWNPAGPYLVTPEGIPNINSVSLTLRVNGETMQHGTTADMVFDPASIVCYLSQFLRLEPGDLINTGTPAGVGLGMLPPRFLHDGDVIDVEVGQLGRQRSRVCIPAAGARPLLRGAETAPMQGLGS
ncbi:fumarylacetoacetate hydrolase family protein [Pseudonocardia aurantiaca]|uniref:Fumarylacetoacetate hydrolase family protein n=1 Tax=Pseudonocardia aurantiaca TaxID=75290 RepID=A0ABW4FZG2_9PSEU